MRMIVVEFMEKGVLNLSFINIFVNWFVDRVIMWIVEEGIIRRIVIVAIITMDPCMM